MSQPTKQRPPQVSLASGIVMFSSVVVLLTAWERVTSLGSLETQEAIRDLLAALKVRSGVLARVLASMSAAAAQQAVLLAPLGNDDGGPR